MKLVVQKNIDYGVISNETDVYLQITPSLCSKNHGIALPGLSL